MLLFIFLLIKILFGFSLLFFMTASHFAHQTQEQLALEASLWASCFNQKSFLESKLIETNDEITSIRNAMLALKACVKVPHPACQSSLTALSASGVALELYQESQIQMAFPHWRNQIRKSLDRNQMPEDFRVENPYRHLFPRMAFERSPKQSRMLGHFPLPRALQAKTNLFSDSFQMHVSYASLRNLPSWEQVFQIRKSKVNDQNRVRSWCGLKTNRELTKINVQIDLQIDLKFEDGKDIL